MRMITKKGGQAFSKAELFSFTVSLHPPVEGTDGFMVLPPSPPPLIGGSFWTTLVMYEGSAELEMSNVHD